VVAFYSGFNVFSYLTFRAIVSLLTALFISLWMGPCSMAALREPLTKIVMSACWDSSVRKRSVSSALLVMVVGDMGELGDEAEACHRQVGEAAKAAGIDCVLCTTCSMAALREPLTKIVMSACWDSSVRKRSVSSASSGRSLFRL
jgi:hypothetical protein